MDRRRGGWLTEGLDARLVRVQVGYEQAVFGGDAKSLDEAERGGTALDAGVALARGRLLHARFLHTGLNRNALAEPNKIDAWRDLVRRASGPLSGPGRLAS